MSQRNDTLAYALGHINAAYIAEAELPALTAAASCPCRVRRERNIPRFWENGWFAAAVSGLVAVGVLAAIVLAGQRTPKPPVGTTPQPPAVSESVPTDPEDTEAPTDVPPETETAAPHTVPQGYSVTDAVYDYRDETVILLRVENQTDENVTLRVQMVYLDENGQEIGRDGQTVSGFSARFGKYLLFRTSEAVSSYVYEVKTKPYTGQYPDHLYQAEFDRLEEMSLPIFPDENGNFPDGFQLDGTYYPCIAVYMNATYTGDIPVTVTRTHVLFDNQGEIYCIYTMGSKYLEPTDEIMPNIAMLLEYTTADAVEWPPELLGEGVTCIGIYSVEPVDESLFLP